MAGTTTSSLRAPGSLWSKLIDASTAASKKSADGKSDSFLYFIGPRGSGKSTLLNRFLYPSKPPEAVKPSQGVEYTYARKPAALDHERCDLAHIWELGGGEQLAGALTSADNVFLSFRQVASSTVVLVVDLSDPGAVLPSLLAWLGLLRARLAATYALFDKKGLQLPEQLRARARARLYSGHEDKDVVWTSGISLVIAATKADSLAQRDLEGRKALARALRYVAHSHGAHLCYVGGLGQPGGGQRGGEGDAELLRQHTDNFTRLLQQLVFSGLDKRPSSKLAPQLAHLAPLWVPAGTDKLRDIGRPRGGGGDVADIATGAKEWQALCEKLLPPPAKEARSGRPELGERAREEAVDGALLLAQEQLEALVAEAEQQRWEELLRKKAALIKAQQQQATSQQQGQQQQQQQGQHRAQQAGQLQRPSRSSRQQLPAG